MKTSKFLPLLIILILFSSCNAAKNYANYRVGGKSPKKEIFVKSIDDIKNNPSKSSALEMMPAHDTLELSRNKMRVEDSIAFHSNKKEKFVTNNIIRGKVQNMVVGMRMDTKGKTKASGNKALVKTEVEILPGRKSPIKNTSTKLTHSSVKSFVQANKNNADAEDVLYFISGTLIIGAGVFALVAAGISLAEIVIFGLGFIGVLFLLYLLGEAFMNIFPGMSRKIRKSFSPKNILSKLIPSRAMKSYGGMSISAYFYIGLLVILVASLFTLIFYSLFDAVMLATLLFSIHLGISLILCIGYGLVYICTGGMMNLKRK